MHLEPPVFVASRRKENPAATVSLSEIYFARLIETERMEYFPQPKWHCHSFYKSDFRSVVMACGGTFIDAPGSRHNKRKHAPLLGLEGAAFVADMNRL